MILVSGMLICKEDRHTRNVLIDSILYENNMNCVNGMVTKDKCCASCVHSFENVITDWTKGC